MFYEKKRDVKWNFRYLNFANATYYRDFKLIYKGINT